MRSYTSLEQSKKLAEILPIESADMAWYSSYAKDGYTIRMLNDAYPLELIGEEHDEIPAWSLAALLDIIRNNGRYEMQMYEGGYYFEANGFMTESYFNSIDACYEMIIKLSEQKLL